MNGDSGNEETRKRPHALLNDRDYLCEHRGCENEETTEWVAKDEEGSYYAYVCSSHPLTNTEFRIKE